MSVVCGAVSAVPFGVGMCMAACMLVVVMTSKLPDEKGESGEDQYCPHEVPLLCIDLTLELQADDGDDTGQQDRGQHMTRRGEGADACHTHYAPALGARNHCQWQPVVGQNRVQN